MNNSDAQSLVCNHFWITLETGNQTTPCWSPFKRTFSPEKNPQTINGLASNPSATVVTVTRKACNRINTLMLDKTFADKQPLLVNANCHCDLPPFPLYQGMRVMITHNRDGSEICKWSARKNKNCAKQNCLSCCTEWANSECSLSNVRFTWWKTKNCLFICASICNYHLQSTRAGL